MSHDTQLRDGRAKPLVSVCIVTYNQESYIRDAVESVLTQDSGGFDLEVLVGDDASTDKTPDVLRELSAAYPGRLTVIHRAANIGAAENYLQLMARARGDFVAHLDGDDYWLPGKLSAQLAFLDTHPDCVAVYTNAIVVDATGVLVGAFSNTQPEKIDLDYLVSGGNFLNHSSLVYRASALGKLLSLPAPFIDYLLHLTLAKDANLGVLNTAYVVYRRMTSTSMLKNQFTHVDALYLQTVVSMAEGLGEQVRANCCASYLVHTLSSRPAWCLTREFWTRVAQMMRDLRVGRGRLLRPLFRILCVAGRRLIASRLSRLANGEDSLLVFHRRL